MRLPSKVAKGPPTKPNTATRSTQPPPPGTRTGGMSSASLGGQSPGWQRQLHHWESIKAKFGLTDDRYDEFRYLTFLDIEDPYVDDYFNFHNTGTLPTFRHRLRKHIGFWRTLCTPEWLMDVIENGVTIPFDKPPPRIMLPNNKSILLPNYENWIVDTLLEYESLGFIEQVDWIPHCVLPLQIKETIDKKSLIYDMSPLNEFVEKCKFKLESWEIMFYYAQHATHAVKFDL